VTAADGPKNGPGRRLSAAACRRGLGACLVASGLLLAETAPGAELHVPVGSGVEVSVQRYAAPKGRLLLWLATPDGMREAEDKVAAAVNGAGIEVWWADLLAARFLLPTPGGIDSVPVADVIALVERARRDTGKPVVLLAEGRLAIPALRAAVALQRSGQREALSGLILLAPVLYRGEPSPGGMAPYIPEAGKLAYPAVVLQPERSPGRWWLERLASQLESGGSRVTVKMLPGVRDHFLARSDATDAETRFGRELPQWLLKAIEALPENAGAP
jgi:hypothetical protein